MTLTLITSTLARAAHHSIPSTTSESWPIPIASSTFTADSDAAGATPLKSDAMDPPVPSPAAIDATCVPCPWSSYATACPFTRSWNGIGAFESSCSWVGSTPVSTTQISEPGAVDAVVGPRLLGAEVPVGGLHRGGDAEVGLEADQARPAGERLGAGGA